MAFLKGVKDEIEVNLTAEIDTDLGKVIKVPFIARYRRLSVQDAKAISERVRLGEVSDDDVLREHLLGWRDLKGHNDETVEFSADVLEEALGVLGYRNALLSGFSVAQFGRKAALQKN